jgi:hypothetical protein
MKHKTMVCDSAQQIKEESVHSVHISVTDARTWHCGLLGLLAAEPLRSLRAVAAQGGELALVQQLLHRPHIALLAMLSSQGVSFDGLAQRFFGLLFVHGILYLIAAKPFFIRRGYIKPTHT